MLHVGKYADRLLRIRDVTGRGARSIFWAIRPAKSVHMAGLVRGGNIVWQGLCRTDCKYYVVFNSAQSKIYFDR
jgi:hypothetical protein